MKTQSELTVDEIIEKNAPEITKVNTHIVAILARVERAEAECLEQARLLGMSGEREADLLGKLERLERELTAERERVRVLSEHGVEALMLARSWQMVWGDKLSPDSVAIFTKHEQEFLAALAAMKGTP